MKQALRDQWVAALRGGNYKQGPGWLRRNGEYCCLGVLEEITGNLDPVVDDGVEYGVERAEGRASSTASNAATFPSSQFLQYVGLDPYTASLLAGMNDRGVPFERIARSIEEQVEVEDS